VVLSLQVGDDPLKVAVEHLRDQPYNPNDDHLKATTLEIVSTLKELLHLHPLYNEQLRSFAAFGGDFHDLSRLADMGASLTSADEAALQGVLEELSVPTRCAMAASFNTPFHTPVGFGFIL
jgi:Lon-like ATP-dependent protease